MTYRSAAAAVSRLPEPVVDAAGKAIATALARPASAGGAMYIRHLQRVLGRPVPAAEQRRWLRLAYRNYARYWVEGARLGSMAPDVIEARMAVASGWQPFVDAMAEGRGLVLALPHVGSWEWGGAWLALEGYPMTSVAEKLDSEQLFAWLVEQRERMGLRIVPLGPEAGPALLHALRQGGLVGLLCDRDIAGGGVSVEFFGERTTLPAGPATLALRTGATLMAGAVYSGPGDSHTATILPPIDTTRLAGLRAD
ncbi:MAG TPA: hypothetical protein VK386_10090, partial [Acidimicrobiales bacterium]|nr:hypothetical protein [Acidimicrobiales bacterium]